MCARSFAGDPRIFGQNQAGAAERFGRARGQIAKVADGGCDDVQAGRETVNHGTGLTSSN